MRGDFSRWRDERRFNFNGVLHQQGRVLLDGDWNAQTALTNDWQDTSGRDAFGAGVAAVPADAPESFLIRSASLVNGQVRLMIAPGRVWADGLLVRLEAETDVPRVATYLQPPIQDPPFDPTTIAAGVRDAVVLEVWREEVNGFQLPRVLIEPALGGPDTTERVHTGMAFRLLRLTDPDDTCDSIIDDLQDDFDAKGRLTVTLDAPVVVPGDCPVTDDGGYTGFEHNLYRIEVAETNSAAPMFKWSQFGGGLVGRGTFDPVARTLTINANDQAIVNSGLSEFYLEAYEFDPAPFNTLGLGHWRVVYGARVTLNSGTGVFSLPAAADPNTLFGAIPGSTPARFFRLWNGIEAVADFDGPAAVELQDGILLQFDPAAGANYVAGDYWTFSVRAGEIDNQSPLIDDRPPEGIHYHRVPLGILSWVNPPAAEIEDCRRVFQPLTKLSTCCTYRVGDGRRTHGDFTSIQAAVNALPAAGGKVCVLPGVYEENVLIEQRRNITIEGCGPRSRVVSPPGAGGAPAGPVFHVVESQDIKILSLAVEADETGIAILLEGRPLEVLVIEEQGQPPLMNVTLEDLLVRASTRSAIHAEVCYFTTIRRCRVEMEDVATAFPAVFFIGDDGLIECNQIIVPNGDQRLAGFDVVSQLNTALIGPAEAAIGGLQLGGGCERVRVRDNLIARGIGIGIKLGSLVTVTTDGDPVPEQPEPEPDPCFPCRPGDNTVPDPGDGTTRTVSAGDLYDIEIVGNKIYNMGLDGVGVAGFFPLGGLDEFIRVHGLLIDSNEIRFNLRRQLQDIPEPMLGAMGYGGIALADVDDLVVRDNFITDNGPDFREPVCGVFVLHGEGVEISRNHILDNGARPPDSQESAAAVKRGRRGGIHVVYAVAPVVPVTINQFTVPAQGGFPALKVHDNVVSVPVGRALSATAVGAVSVVGNQLTSRGMSRQDSQTFVASTVFILNLGLSNELYMQLLAFSAVMQGTVQTVGTNLTAGAGRPGLDDRGIGRFLVGGNVLFAANQCSFDVLETGVSFAVSSVFIASLDDVGFHDNQCDCNLFDDFVLTQAFLFGLSLRVSDNRFKEGLFNALFSAVTLGLFNTTTDNQSTHCLWIIGLPVLTVDHSNTSLMALAFGRRNPCCQFLVHKEDCAGRGTPDNLSVNTVPTFTRG